MAKKIPKKEIYYRDGGHCRYCGKNLTSFSDWLIYTIDHVVPRAAGGTDEADNLVLCCPSCNWLLSRAVDCLTVESRGARVAELRMVWRRYWQRDIIASKELPRSK